MADQPLETTQSTGEDPATVIPTITEEIASIVTLLDEAAKVIRESGAPGAAAAAGAIETLSGDYSTAKTKFEAAQTGNSGTSTV